MFSIGMTVIIGILFAPLIVLMVLGIKAGGKKRIIAITVPCAILLALALTGAKIYYDYNHVIGTFSGAEYDNITIDSVTYEIETNSKYSSHDTDKLLGRVDFAGNTQYRDPEPMYVWSIKGSDDHIYAIAGDGAIYKKAG